MPQSMSVKPGCFGSPLCYSEKSPLCKQCVYRDECGPASEARSKVLMERFGIAPLLATSRQSFNKQKAREIRKATEPAKSEPKESALDKVARIQADRLRQQGMDLAKQPLEQMEFSELPPFLHEAWNLFVRGGCNASELIKLYQTKWGWSAQDAMSYATLAIKVLQKSGAARFEAGRNSMVPVKDMVAEVIE